MSSGTCPNRAIDSSAGDPNTHGIASTLLSVQDVSIRFGGIVALDRVSFDVPEKAIVGLIGPNGAGKTTMFNCITRLYRPQSGRIEFAGASLLDQAPHDVIRRGIARTFQNVALFPRMTVLQNVMVGLHSRLVGGPLYFLGAGLRLPGVRRAESAALQVAREAIAYVGLSGLEDRPVSGLSFGTLKAVEMARALTTRPRLLLLDEPAGGLNHDEVAGLVDLIKDTHQRYQLTILVVEHHMNLVMRVSDQVVCLDFGKKIADGTPREVQEDRAVIEAYLGTLEDGAA